MTLLASKLTKYCFVENGSTRVEDLEESLFVCCAGDLTARRVAPIPVCESVLEMKNAETCRKHRGSKNGKKMKEQNQNRRRGESNYFCPLVILGQKCSQNASRSSSKFPHIHNHNNSPKTPTNSNSSLTNTAKGKKIFKK